MSLADVRYPGTRRSAHRRCCCVGGRCWLA